MPDPSSPAVSYAGQQVTIGSVDLSPEQSLTITYTDATVQGSAGPATFDTSERTGGGGLRTEIQPPPVVTVTCADGTGTETVSRGRVTAGSTSTLTFTYRPARGCQLAEGALSLTIPPGWTQPADAQDAAGSVTTSPGALTVVLSGSVITVTGITLAAGQTFAITYSHATAPHATTTSTFDTAERATSAGDPVPLDPSPQVTVEPLVSTSSPSPTLSTSSSPTASGGTVQPTGVGQSTAATGTMSVAPTTVTASRPGTLTFTYQPPGNGMASPGEVTLMVPAGWSPPSTAPGQAGYTTSTPGALSVSGAQITVTGLALGPGQALTITYRPTAAPHAAGSSVFDAAERPGGGDLLALASSPTVAVAGPSPFHIPLPLLVVLLAAGCVAAVSAVRHLRHRTGTTTPSSVAAEPETGQPGTVSVQQTGTGETHAISIQPHPDAAVTTIEEMRT